MSESYTSNFNSGGWNYSNSTWDQSYTCTQSDWSYTEPTPPSWGLDYEQEEMCRRLDKLEDEEYLGKVSQGNRNSSNSTHFNPNS